MSFQKTKTDPVLGNEIQQHLESLGIHTPVNKLYLNVDAKDKISKIEGLLTKVFETIGLDLSDDSLIETPKRVAKMMVLDEFWGMLPENFPKNTVIEDKMKVDEMVTVGDIQVHSFCEHHALPIIGKAYVAYIAQGQVIGLSKLARVVEYFSRRPQVQERLTSQIYHALAYMLGTENVAVGIRAIHMCMSIRGVEDSDAWTQTTKLGGVFKTNAETRAEFLRMLP
jgi:GTP cyclohydrolase I